MITIGNVDGHDIVFNPEEGTLSSKDFTVEADKVLSAYESPFDRVNVQGNLVLRKYKNEVTLGCFSIPIKKFEIMKLKILKSKLNNK